MRVCSFLCSDSLLYTSFFFFLFYMVFIHVMIVRVQASNKVDEGDWKRAKVYANVSLGLTIGTWLYTFVVSYTIIYSIMFSYVYKYNNY